MEMMSSSTIHPIGVPPRRTMPIPTNYRQGTSGTIGSIGLRVLQFASSLISAAVMATTDDFDSEPPFILLVGVMSLQGLWSFIAGTMDAYVLFLKETRFDYRLLWWFTIGDTITSHLSLFAASGVAALTSFIRIDLSRCAYNSCGRFETSMMMAFVSSFAALASSMINGMTCHFGRKI